LNIFLEKKFDAFPGLALTAVSGSILCRLVTSQLVGVCSVKFRATIIGAIISLSYFLNMFAVPFAQGYLNSGKALPMLAFVFGAMGSIYFWRVRSSTPIKSKSS
jgi:hypothetical protein